MSVIHNLRKSFETRGLSESDLDADPLKQFQSWFDQAVQHKPGDWFEVNAMTLSTCSQATGQVTSRTVLLKQFDENGFVFFTNYESEKGKQLAENPQAALLLYWPYLARQIRINGHVAKTTREVSEKYFHSRPRRSQLGASASVQSSELDSRERLERATSELDVKHRGKEVPLPQSWGGYCLQPVRFEFWQGRTNRLHDRFRYLRIDDNSESASAWGIIRLYP